MNSIGANSTWKFMRIACIWKFTEENTNSLWKLQPDVQRSNIHFRLCVIIRNKAPSEYPRSSRATEITKSYTIIISIIITTRVLIAIEDLYMYTGRGLIKTVSELIKTVHFYKPVFQSGCKT